MLYSDIREIKKILEIENGNTEEDLKLSFFIEMATSWIDEYLGKNLEQSSRTQYYRGSGSQRLLLKNRPVLTSPEILVYVDQGAYYGSASGAFTQTGAQWTYGVDFCLDIDQDDGSSRSGILIAMNKFWPKPSYRQAGWLSPFVGRDTGSVKVVYTAGYTPDSLPSVIRLACNTLVARLRYFFPLSMELGSESYEERSIVLIADKKNYLMSAIVPMILPYKNWSWGGGT